MATTSPLQGIPLPDAGDADNVPYDLANAVDAIEKRLVMAFATATARDSALPSPAAGMVCYITGTKTYYGHDGTGWRILSLRDSNGGLTLQPSSGNALTFYDAGGTLRSVFDAQGRLAAGGGVHVGGTTHSGQGYFEAFAPTPDSRMVLVKRAAGHTANLVEVLDENGNVLGGFDANGEVQSAHRAWTGATASLVCGGGVNPGVNGYFASAFRRIGNVVHFRFETYFGGTGISVPSGALEIALGNAPKIAAGSMYQAGRGYWSQDNDFASFCHGMTGRLSYRQGGGYVTLFRTSDGAPWNNSNFTPGSGDILAFSATYETTDA